MLFVRAVAIVLALAGASEAAAISSKSRCTPRKNRTSTSIATATPVKTPTPAPNAYGVSEPAKKAATTTTSAVPVVASSSTKAVPASTPVNGGDYGVDPKKPVASSTAPESGKPSVKPTTPAGGDYGSDNTKPVVKPTVPAGGDGYGAPDQPAKPTAKPTVSEATTTPCSTSTASQTTTTTPCSTSTAVPLPSTTSSVKSSPAAPSVSTSTSTSASVTSTSVASSSSALPTTKLETTTSTTTSGIFVPPAPTKIPEAPKGLGREEIVPFPDPAVVPPFVDNFFTNQINNPCFLSMDTNAGVRVVAPYLQIWTPVTLKVDAGINLASNGVCPAATPGPWSGIPEDPTDGKHVRPDIHKHNIDYCINVTQARPDSQIPDVYFEDRRTKGYNLIDGLGPLAEAWFKISKVNTSIPVIPANAAQTQVRDTGNGWGDLTDPNFAKLASFLDKPGINASSEPSKRFYKYARPYRWSTRVSVPDVIRPSLSSNPATDGGPISGHTAEAYRKGLGIGWLVPERLQEMYARAFQSGEYRILAGAHSPYDVIGSRVHATAFVAGNFLKVPRDERRRMRVLARDMILRALNTTDSTFPAVLARAGDARTDKFANLDAVWETVKFRFTYGFPIINPTNVPAKVPKGAEVLLESRFPYLSDDQRRTILRATAFESGYPIMDDAEGWGRLNLFTAAAGPAQLDGDLDFVQDAANGDFSAYDSWRNPISGAGRIAKSGSGNLALAANNTFTGGLAVLGGFVEALAYNAFGNGDVFVDSVAGLGVRTLARVGGNLSLAKAAYIGFAPNAALEVKGELVVDGALLTADTQGLPSGSVVQLIKAAKVFGKFESVLGGKVVYSPTTVSIIVA
ncbi:hypothetical protein HDU96_000499 [Phlyctochytrium bullatum]|nr:hypothetical protein HDU96_000499 [Phlyctochytrium bullatum]